MKIRYCFTAALLIPLFLLNGCASIVTKSTYMVPIVSNPTGARIEIYDKKNKLVYEGTTPVNPILPTSKDYMEKEIYTIKILKEGYNDYEYMIASHITGWYWVNILFGGLIGMLIVDPITGCMYNIPKNTAVEAQLSPDTSVNRAENGLVIMTLDEVPEELRSELVLLGE